MSLFDDYVASMSGTDASGFAGLSPQGQEALRLNAGGAGLNMVGVGAGIAGNFMLGLHAQRAAEYTAEQLRINAGQERASSQRAAYEQDQKTQLVMSRALAVAAASGGGASDPTVVNIIAAQAAQGAYLRSVALYEGDDRARTLEANADAREYEGRLDRINSLVGAAGQGVRGAASILGSAARGASLYSRFAGDGPSLDAFGGNS